MLGSGRVARQPPGRAGSEGAPRGRSHHGGHAARADRAGVRPGAALRPRGPPAGARPRRSHPGPGGGRCRLMHHLTPLMKATIGFAYLGGLAFVVIGVVLSWQRRRLHPLLLVCLSALSFSWIE